MMITPELARWVADELGLTLTAAELEQLREGIEVELEHGGLDPLTGVINGDVIQAARIAIAHLWELPDYYTRLRAMEQVRGVGSVYGHPQGRIPPRVTVGDWGCVGVDTDEWRKQNRAPLFPGKMNRWLLVRTLRDNPTESDIRETLYFVFAKWFKGMAVDPLLATNTGGRAGGGIFENMAIDNLNIVNASREPILLPGAVMRRESLPYPPVPTLNPEAPVIYLSCEFAYRGERADITWPVRTAAPGGLVQLKSSAHCPVGADWMLASVGEAELDAPPEESISTILRKKGADAIIPLINMNFWPLVILGGVALGAYLLKPKIRMEM